MSSADTRLHQKVDPARLERTRRNAAESLLSARLGQAHWTGELSASALSTATAAFALHRAGGHDTLVEAGLDWLAAHQNEDGGFGDTVRSKSNISTTALCWAALGIAERWATAASRAEQWLDREAGSIEPAKLAEAIKRRYGRDRTFSVPILTMCALAGRLGKDGWRYIPALPFELAVLPQRWYRWARLPVVSYALPALIALGAAHHRAKPSAVLPVRWVRQMSRGSALRVLERIQPSNGGFLEAAPLTSFVTMSLVDVVGREHPVLRRCVAFLVASARGDGSWPIDTNLATWVTTLSVNALAGGGQLGRYLREAEREAITAWLVGQQYRQVHPYTGAAAGGWAWSDLPGAVPDADDTAGAMLALRELGADSEQSRRAAEAGGRWLAGLQNRDGGIPTFCRGWGKLPFDRSSNDITAHAMRAWEAWGEIKGTDAREGRGSFGRSLMRAGRFVAREQRQDGAWLPLWFGNQHAADDANPLYGTTRVLLALTAMSDASDTVASGAARRAVRWLIDAQQGDGGWGGDRDVPASIEETALACEALACAAGADDGEEQAEREAIMASLADGMNWLIERTQQGTRFEPSPIGFYFAKLWYFEKLYPMVYAVAALERASAVLEPRQ